MGKLSVFVQEEQAVVVDLGHDGVVYDTATGEDVTDTRPLADWEQDRVLVTCVPTAPMMTSIY